jgi:hypothetical protein
VASFYTQVVKLGLALEADGVPNSFTENVNIDYPVFHVRVYELKVSWRGMPTRKLERLLREVPIEKVPTLVGTDWKFEESDNTQFFLKLRLKYGI